MNIKTNKLLTALFAAAVFITPIAQAQTQSAAPVVVKADRQDEAAIRRLLKDYAAALKATSPQAVTALFTADGVIMPPGAPTVSGSQGLQARYERSFAAAVLDLTFDVLEINVNGNHAFVRSTSSGTITAKAGNTQKQDSFRELFVLEKVNGQWKIARYMFNQDH